MDFSHQTNPARINVECSLKPLPVRLRVRGYAFALARRFRFAI